MKQPRPSYLCTRGLGLADISPLPAMEAATEPLACNKLTFDISPDMKAAIATAHANYQALQNSVETAVLEFKHFGKNEIKNWKVSPDAAVQMAYQVRTPPVTVPYTLSSPARKLGAARQMMVGVFKVMVCV